MALVLWYIPQFLAKCVLYCAIYAGSFNICNMPCGTSPRSAYELHKLALPMYTNACDVNSCTKSLCQTFNFHAICHRHCFVVTKRGKPIALIMSMDDYESILETLEILSDKKLMGKLKQADRDIKKGNLKTLERIEKEMGIV